MKTKTIIKLLKDSQAYAAAMVAKAHSEDIESFWRGKIQGLEFAIKLLEGK